MVYVSGCGRDVDGRALAGRGKRGCPPCRCHTTVAEGQGVSFALRWATEAEGQRAPPFFEEGCSRQLHLH